MGLHFSFELNYSDGSMRSEIHNSSKTLLLPLPLFKKKIIIITITIRSVLKITITIKFLLLLLKCTRLKANMMNVLKNYDPIWIGSIHIYHL
jgi:hypothetical protein